jgi:hypothetical protein
VRPEGELILQRRDLKRGQRAMIYALVRPVPESQKEIASKGGKAKAAKATGSAAEPVDLGFSKAHLSAARFVLKHDEELAKRRKVS